MPVKYANGLYKPALSVEEENWFPVKCKNNSGMYSIEIPVILDIIPDCTQLQITNNDIWNY
jgi:hypothetical protein